MEYITLMGAEDVRAAANRISEAAHVIRQSASEISEAMHLHQQTMQESNAVLADLIEQLKAVKPL